MIYTELVKRGLPIFPVNRETKQPLVAWKSFQTELPSLERAANWDTNNPLTVCNVGMATGALSGVVVVDVDSDEGLGELSKYGFVPRTWTVKTGRGQHFYFQAGGLNLGNKAGFVPGVDFRGQGGFIIIPPSVHATGHAYQWSTGPDDMAEPAPMPEWLVLLLNPPAPAPGNGAGHPNEIEPRSEYWFNKYVAEATIGTRNHTLYKLGLQLHAEGMTLAMAETTALLFRSQVGGPDFTDKEALATMRSAYSGEPFRPAGYGQPLPSIPRALSLTPNAPAVVMPSNKMADYTDLPADPLFVDERFMLQETMDMLLSVPEAMPQYPPVLFPVKLLHQLGGNAHYTLRGQLIYIMAAPGDGKTSFAEYCAARLRQRGQDVIWYSPEWGKYMPYRSLQRHDGPLIDAIAAHQVYYAEGLKGVQDGQRGGEPLPQEMVDAGVRIMADMMHWPGSAYHITKASLTFDELVARTIAAIEYSRKQGGDPAWVIWDYLETLRRFGPSDTFWGEVVADVFQAIGIDYGIVPVLLHQPKKGAAEKVQNAALEGDDLYDVLLDGSSGQGITNQKCNLGITINPHRDVNGNTTGIALLNVYKQSTGRIAYGNNAIKIGTDFEHLTFIDSEEQ